MKMITIPMWVFIGLCIMSVLGIAGAVTAYELLKGMLNLRG